MGASRTCLQLDPFSHLPQPQQQCVDNENNNNNNPFLADNNNCCDDSNHTDLLWGIPTHTPFAAVHSLVMVKYGYVECFPSSSRQPQ